jgi:hypothetical protein
MEAWKESQGFWKKYYSGGVEIFFTTGCKRNEMERRPLLTIVEST